MLMTGWLFAALNIRADSFSEFCVENVISDSSAGDKTHPYLNLIRHASPIPPSDFWRNLISDYDMYGRAYIFLLRRIVKDKDGKISHVGLPVSIEVLDAKNVTVLTNNTGEVVGYREMVSAGAYREFYPEQIVPIINPNPMDRRKSFSIFEAAYKYQYTISKGTEFAQQALVNNLNIPGILGTEQTLNDEEYDNLVSQLNSHEAGKVIIADGASKLTYTPMSQDIDRASLPTLNEISRQTIFAITGTSKTILGIEESGTTRETSKIQERKFIKRTIAPLAKKVLSHLNYDYVKYYKHSDVTLTLSSVYDPIESRDFFVTQKQLFDSITEMTYAGYSPDSSERFLYGEIPYTALELENYSVENSLVKNQLSEQISGQFSLLLEKIQMNELNESKDYQLTNDDEFPVLIMNADLDEKSSLNKESLKRAVEGLKDVRLASFYIKEEHGFNSLVAKLEETDELLSAKENVNKHAHHEELIWNPEVRLAKFNSEYEADYLVPLLGAYVGKTLKVIGYLFDEDESEINEEPKDNHIDHVCSHDCDHDRTNSDSYADKVLNRHKEDGELTEYGRLLSSKITNAKKQLLKDVREAQRSAVKQADLKLAKNAFDFRDIRSDEDHETLYEKLKNAFKKYWLVMLPLVGKERIIETSEEHGFNEEVNLLGTKSIKEYIEFVSSKLARTHTETIYNDILKAANKGEQTVFHNLFFEKFIEQFSPDEFFNKKPSKRQVIFKLKDDEFKSKNIEMIRHVQSLIEEGYNRREIQKEVLKAYEGLSRKRANVLVGNEMAKAINSSQYLADLELLKKTNKLHLAKKYLVSSTGTPCAVCKELIDQGPIPFEAPFLALGDSIRVQENGKDKVFQANYEDIDSGVVHVNCHCSYRLKIDNEITHG